MSKLIFVSDYAGENIIGGAEIVDDIIYNELNTKFSTERLKSEELKFLDVNSFYFISNFVEIDPSIVFEFQTGKYNYAIMEHDNKYVSTRDPSAYRNYEAPLYELIFRDFYKNARAVFCQTDRHAELLQKNLRIPNVISLKGSIWSEEQLTTLDECVGNAKSSEIAIMDSENPIKNTNQAIRYCKTNNLEYKLIRSQEYSSFIDELSRCSSLLFIPGVFETCSRICVEAKYLGCKVLTNEKVGVVHEEWFRKEDITEYVSTHKDRVVGVIQDLIEGNPIEYFNNYEFPKISIITSMYDGDDHIEGFLDNITKQTIFDKCELIIIDANSPGNEKEVIDSYIEKFPNITYKRLQTDPGIYGCWNIAISNSTGEFITNANLDDRRSPFHLEILVSDLILNEEIDLVYADSYASSEVIKPLGEWDYKQIYPTNWFSRENMIKCLPGPMPVWRASVHEKSGVFDSSYKSAGDWEMWLRFVESGSKFKRILGALGAYYYNPNGLSTSSENHKLKFNEEKRIFERYKDIFGEEMFEQYKGYFLSE